jgi:hypothetical protein
LIVSYYQTVRIDAPNFDLKYTRHSSIISNSIEYPYKYRLLNPFITEIYFSVFKTVLPEKPAFLIAYAVQNLIVYSFLFFTFVRLLLLWFNETGAAAGLLIFALLVPLSLTGYDTLGDITTAGLMALGFYCIIQNKVSLLYPVIFIGSFNELQVILIVWFYLFSNRGNILSGKVWLNSFMLTITFVIGYVIIFLLRGGEAGSEAIIWFFTKDAAFNLTHPDFILLWAIMILPLLYFAVMDFKAKPEFLRRNLLTVIPLFYVIVFFFTARMREIDKALAIFIILIPLALHSLMPGTVKKEGASL